MVKNKKKRFKKIKIDVVSKEVPNDKKWYWRDGKKVLLGENEYYDNVQNVII